MVEGMRGPPSCHRRRQPPHALLCPVGVGWREKCSGWCVGPWSQGMRNQHFCRQQESHGDRQRDACTRRRQQVMAGGRRLLLQTAAQRARQQATRVAWSRGQPPAAARRGETTALLGERLAWPASATSFTRTAIRRRLPPTAPASCSPATPPRPAALPPCCPAPPPSLTALSTDSDCPSTPRPSRVSLAAPRSP